MASCRRVKQSYRVLRAMLGGRAGGRQIGDGSICRKSSDGPQRNARSAGNFRFFAISAFSCG